MCVSRAISTVQQAGNHFMRLSPEFLPQSCDTFSPRLPLGTVKFELALDVLRRGHRGTSRLLHVPIFRFLQPPFSLFRSWRNRLLRHLAYSGMPTSRLL